MTDEQRLQYFLNGTGLTLAEDSIYVGTTSPHLAPAGINEVMKHHVAEIDGLLQKFQVGSIQALELFTTRGFSFDEFKALFDLGIKERDFNSHPVFKSLWISTEVERRKVIYPLDRESFDDYFALLTKCLAPFNPHLLTFFFTAIAYG